MYNEEIIGGHRLRQVDRAVIIDEWQGIPRTIFHVAFGLVFTFPLFLIGGALLFKNGILGMSRPDFSQPENRSVAGWLVVAPFFCVPFIFAYLGSRMAFARYHIEVTSEKILIGNAWFGVPVGLKTLPVSEIKMIQLTSTEYDRARHRWYFAVSALTTKRAKPVLICSSPEKKGALDLAGAISKTAKLPVQEIAQT